MGKEKVIIEWAQDGTIGAMLENEQFAGLGDTVEEAVKDMREGIKLFIETAQEKNFPYKEYLDSDFEIELSYDIKSLLSYLRTFMTDAGISKLTGVNPLQINRYANGKSIPRPEQRRKLLEGLKKFGNTFSAISL